MGVKIEKNCFIDRKSSFRGFYGSIQIGDNCIIGPNVRIKASQNIENREKVIFIVSNVFIGYGSIIDAVRNVEVYPYTMIGPYVFITDTNHVLKERNIPIAKKGSNSKSTIIEKNVWIRSHCQILMGVRIGANSIVAVNSTDTKSMKGNSLILGAPAFIKKQLFE